MTWVVVGAVVVALALIVFFVKKRRTPDGVASFQRQIDALSPDARRSVVQRLEDVTRHDQPGRNDPRTGDGDVDGA